MIEGNWAIDGHAGAVMVSIWETADGKTQMNVTNNFNIRLAAVCAIQSLISILFIMSKNNRADVINKNTRIYITLGKERRKEVEFMRFKPPYFHKIMSAFKLDKLTYLIVRFIKHSGQSATRNPHSHSAVIS
jgi:hypothetical protein